MTLLTSRSRSLRAAALGALSVLAASGARSEEWKWSITPYVWATDVGVDVEIVDRRVVDETIAFDDLVEDLDAGALVHLEAQRGAHGVMFDLFDVRMSDEGDRVALPGAGGAEATLDSEIGMTIFEAAGIYDPRGDQRGFGLLYGTRILRQSADLDFEFALPDGSTVNRGLNADDTFVDGLLGVRYVLPITDRWTLAARVDASAGGTELTWSAGAAVAYAFGESRRYALTAGYRTMTVDFDTQDSTDVDMTLSGILVGLRVSF
jgi:hypothetical protein